MNETPSVPPGWYPDPAGEPQWRVWTGHAWSTMTRPFGPSSSRDALDEVGLLAALYAVIRYGVLGTFGGLAIFVSTLAHLPGTASPSPNWYTETAIATAAALFTIGSMAYALAARALLGRWTWFCFIPLVNLEVVDFLVARRLGMSPVRRVASNSVLIALFCWQFHVAPWFAVAPALVALSHAFWTSELLDRLS